MYLDDDDDDDEESNNYSYHRDPWIPHLEQRDTVPNIELYSVLFHNIPALPSEVMDQYNQDDFIRFTKRECIDWQLCVATAFFDHIVPNQPGFSSSVAAITILPSANQLALAWRKWYVAAGALRKLRYIRTLITSRRHYDIDTISDEDTENKTTSEIPASSKNAWADSTLPLSPYSIPAASTTAPTITNNRGNRHYATQDFRIRSEDEILPERYREVFGSHENPEVENEFFKALDYGPEQTVMYTRELAQGAAACYPYGCNDGRLNHIDFQELFELENDAVKAVHEANLILLEAAVAARHCLADGRGASRWIADKTVPVRKCSSIDGLKEVSICHSFCSYYLFFFALSSLIVLSNFYCFQRKNINISVVTGIHHFSKCANHALLLWCKCYSYLT